MNENKKKPNTLLLIDGSSYFNRAFYAMPDFYSLPDDPTSHPTGVIRGLINLFKTIRRDIPTHYAACVFDAKGTNFRNDLYPQYKANQTSMPLDLRAQVDPIREVASLIGWKTLNVPGMEAADVIGTLAFIAAKEGIEVIVSSGDKDLVQLVNSHITIIDTMNGRRRDVAGVKAEFGVPAHLMVDFQLLAGNATDNVPGVPGIDSKTAIQLLNQYESLNAVMDNTVNTEGAIADGLKNSLDWLPLGRQLLSIKTDCNLDEWVPNLPALGSMEVKAVDTKNLVMFYEKYGFKNMVKSIQEASIASKGAPKAAPKKAKKIQTLPTSTDTPDPLTKPKESRPETQSNNFIYETVLTWDAFEIWFVKLQTADLVSIDTETTSLDEMRAEIVGLSFSVAHGEAAYIPLKHTYPGAPAQLPGNEVLERLKPWLEDATRFKLGQHIKYDRHVFANHGIEVRGYAHDTMLQSYVLEVHKPHGLASLAERHLGRSGISFEELCGKGASQICFNQVYIAKATKYACEDSDMTLDVHKLLYPQIENDKKLKFIYEMEIASSEALFRIERNGVLIDAPHLFDQSNQLNQRILQLENESHELAGQPFNLSSPKQIGEIFFQKLQFPVNKKTTSGAPSTDEEVLEKLAKDFALPAKILEHRSLSKLKGTYTDKLAKLANPRTGRVHTHYAQAVAVTGRLSSNDPNLQNIPIRTPDGRRVREAFVAPPGCLIASADYSQIELRIMAHISGDAELLLAFHNNLDVHRVTAAEIFGVAVNQVTREQRRYAKVINFGLIYGMSAFGVANALNIDNASAKKYIDLYFERYPGVKLYMNQTRKMVKTNGYVETVFGRRLYLPEINSTNAMRRGGAERAAINAPMQGTAADLIKLSMVKVQQVLDDEKKGTKIIMQVHDELVFEVPAEEESWVRNEIPRLMAGVASLKVPLLAKVGMGLNWDRSH